MKDKQQSELPKNPGASPEGSKGTGSRDVRWTPGQFWLDKWLEYLIGVWNGPEAHQKLWSKCGAANPRAYALQLIANRCLIKAAPDLYEELDWLCACAEEGILPGKDRLKRSQAVLAEARGEL